MRDKDTLEALACHPFLKGFSDAHLAALAECAQRVTLTAGAYLGQEGEPANAFYLLQSGRVAIEAQTPDRGIVPIQTLGAGDMVGWSWLAPPHRWQFDARAIEHVGAISFDASCLRDKCERDLQLGYQLLKRLVGVVAGRLMATRLQMLDVQKS